MDKSSGGDSTSGGGGSNSDGGSDSRDLSFGCGLSGGNSASTSSNSVTPSTSKSGSKNIQPSSSSILNSLNCSNNLLRSINDEIVLNISTTTGGNFQVNVHLQQTIDNLKKIISKKLKVSKDRICLLHRERELHDGSLKDNGLMEGSKVILIPNVETGLLAQRPENTVMQALESLNDSQVNDFLSGKTPLNLSMRLGDHMMLIQLQLSTVNPSSPSNVGTSKAHSSHQQRSRRSISATTSHQMNNYQKQRKIDSTFKSDHQSLIEESSAYLSTNLEIPSSGTSSSSSSLNSSPKNRSDLNSYLSKQDFDKIQNIVKKLAQQKPSTSTGISYSSGNSELCNDSNLNYSSETATTDSIFDSDGLLEQSPIKSLSNLVSSPIKTTSIKNIPINNSFNNSNLTDENLFDCTDPIAAKLTSCLCNQYSSSSNNLKSNCETTNCQYSTTNTDVDMVPPQTTPKSTSTPIFKPSSSNSLHKTSNSAISKSKSKTHNSSNSLIRKNLNSNTKYDSAYNSSSDLNNTSSNDKKMFVADEICDTTSTNSVQSNASDRTLAEASRNLTQTLRKLSKEVFTNKIDTDSESSRKNNNSGAVIESMKNHGKGIYSGTFSGTLNPALQDRFGRPKRDISTVIHILNDLLSATPQYSRGARICFEPPNNRSSSKSSLSKQHKSASTTGTSCTKCSSKSGAYSSECEHNNNLPRSLSQSESKIKTNQKKSEFTSIGISSSQIHNYDYSSLSSIPNPSHSVEKNATCTCGYRNSLKSDNSIDGHIKTICNTCSVQMENNKTKSKLDQLRLVMQQRKQRREERKLKGSPYGGALVAANNTNPSTANANTVTTPLSSSSPNDSTSSHTVEEVETVA